MNQNFRFIKWGSTSVILRIKCNDSSVNTNAGKTGITNATGSLYITATCDNEATATVYTGANLATIAALGTYVAPATGKANIKEFDATNHPGLYEVHLLNTRFNVAGAKELKITIGGAAGLGQTEYTVYLWTVDPYVLNGNLFYTAVR